ncbi:lipase 3-like [Maniola hyperantus]|uniref:lipase 3-like n=1 Tax=Aphantopus hyperantus TaxID=2795564 RepID=UPI0015690749|nr:lipase 3-like [Maniola hyperantus]XP_034830993.1 lipase 3-like [Maniola hyperantus]
MNVLYLCAALALVARSAAIPLQVESWPFEMNPMQNFSENMKAFFEVQKDRVERAFSTSYQEAMRMKDSVSGYLDDKGKEISSNINAYVENVKDSGRQMTDKWSYLHVEEPGARKDNPDLSLSVPSIIARHGYSCETHTVVSQEYMLSVHRIPRSKRGEHTPRNTVILQHGLFASSADWILNGPDRALAYVLADAGYDVWMPNIRGNRYSKEHAVLKSDSKSFWNFSWHDVARYDLPAVIDHVAKLKGEEAKITYIGHSMGTTVLFAMLSLRPEYNDRLAAGFALAPVAFLSDVRSPVKALAPIASNVAYMEMLYGSHEFIPKHSVLGKMASSCDADDVDALVCKNVIFYICGYNEKQFNKTLLPVFLANLGTGTSWKTAVHFAQEILAGERFQQFDYGKTDNLKVYGAEQPPEYDLGEITLPIKLFWAENDLLSSEKDVRLLYERLPSTTEMYKVPDPGFNHLDYLWAIDAPTLVNDEVLKSLDKVYSSEPVNFSWSWKL